VFQKPVGKTLQRFKSSQQHAITTHCSVTPTLFQPPELGCFGVFDTTTKSDSFFLRPDASSSSVP